MYLGRSPVKLGGKGKTVEIDESKLGKKRKYNQGKLPNPGFWVFGAVEMITNRFVLCLVNCQDRQTLQPLIEQNIEKETMFSDNYSVYHNLDTLSYEN